MHSFPPRKTKKNRGHVAVEGVVAPLALPRPDLLHGLHGAEELVLGVADEAELPGEPRLAGRPFQETWQDPRFKCPVNVGKKGHPVFVE